MVEVSADEVEVVVVEEVFVSSVGLTIAAAVAVAEMVDEVVVAAVVVEDDDVTGLTLTILSAGNDDVVSTGSDVAVAVAVGDVDGDVEGFFDGDEVGVPLPVPVLDVSMGEVEVGALVEVGGLVFAALEPGNDISFWFNGGADTA